tara:strand:+ start:35293 stop:35469 length:177 start_codon:yes stop_codon:yes gene_type:complete
MARHSAVNRDDVGSNPTIPANEKGRINFKSVLPGRPTAGPRPLTPLILVRIQARQQQL